MLHRWWPPHGLPKARLCQRHRRPISEQVADFDSQEHAYGRELNADNPMLARKTRPYPHPSCKEVLAESVLEEAQARFKP